MYARARYRTEPGGSSTTPRTTRKLKARRCHLLAPPGRRPVDCCSSRLPLNPQEEALGLSVSEALTAPHEKVVPLPHWDVVLVEHPALLDAAGAGWGRCLGTRGEEQDGCHESGARHRASSLGHAEDGAQTLVRCRRTCSSTTSPGAVGDSDGLDPYPAENRRLCVKGRERSPAQTESPGCAPLEE